MDKNKLTIQLEEKIKELEFQNQILRDKQEHRLQEENVFDGILLISVRK